MPLSSENMRQMMLSAILGGSVSPLVVVTYSAWGKEAIETFSMLDSRLATTSSRPKSMVLSELYGWLNLHLVRANVSAILCRKALCSSLKGGAEEHQISRSPS